MSILVEREEAIAAFDDCGVPRHIREGLIAYCTERRQVGGFLTAVLSNDLGESVARADHENAANLPGIVRWLYWHAPGDSWGSPERVKAWLSGRSAKDGE
jgi:hypothetical protein